MTNELKITRLEAKNILSSVDAFKNAALSTFNVDNFLTPDEWQQAMSDVVDTLRVYKTATVSHLPADKHSPADISITGHNDTRIKDKDPAKRIKAARKRLHAAQKRRGLKQ